MENDVIKTERLDVGCSGAFTPYTHPELEALISEVIGANGDALRSDGARQLVRELFLYGFLQVSGQGITAFGKTQVRDRVENPESHGTFCTNNGILGLTDFGGEVYIRGGDSYHGIAGYSSDVPGAVESTLVGLGYEPGRFWVDHSNGDRFVDPKMEKLFEAMHVFSRKARELRGEPGSGMIVKVGFDDKPSAYAMRDPKLPKIVVSGIMMVPGAEDGAVYVKP